ncbi:MAG: hypothetical protein ACYCU7_05330 [Acidimicrobiales bacterium]
MTVGLSPMRLPRARTLTDALVAPVVGPVPVLDPVVRSGLCDGLARLEGRLPAGQRLRVDEYLLSTSGADGHPPPVPPMAEPFRWSARTARRSVGLAAVRACYHGVHRTPAEAVAGVVERLAEDAGGSTGRGGSLGRWLAGLPSGARAAVQADAVTWATRLHIALDWGSLPPGTEVGGRDEWWDCPSARRIGLRGRAEVRTSTGGGSDAGTASARPVLFCLRPGGPGPTGRTELALPALVAALGSPTGAPPARVVGWWPSCGRAIVLEVDDQLLARAATSVVGAVGARLGGGARRHAADR